MASFLTLTLISSPELSISVAMNDSNRGTKCAIAPKN
jgi:hypothetical protein